jgi:hypothetical protein
LVRTRRHGRPIPWFRIGRIEREKATIGDACIDGLYDCFTDKSRWSDGPMARGYRSYGMLAIILFG